MGYISIPTDLTGYSKINNSNYTGNNSVNRAIPHGLGIIPKTIILTIVNDASIIKISHIGKITFLNTITNSNFTITNWDDTNFYVGNATEYTQSGNANAVVYHWVAIG